jgi:hypothetical protein
MTQVFTTGYMSFVHEAVLTHSALHNHYLCVSSPMLGIRGLLSNRIRPALGTKFHSIGALDGEQCLTFGPGRYANCSVNHHA